MPCFMPSSCAPVCPLNFPRCCWSMPPRLPSWCALFSVLLCGGAYVQCRRDVKLVHELYFPLQPSKDVAFEIGRIFMGLKDFSSAAELFRCEELQSTLYHRDAFVADIDTYTWICCHLPVVQALLYTKQESFSIVGAWRDFDSCRRNTYANTED